MNKAESRSKNKYWKDWLKRTGEPIKIEKLNFLERIKKNGYYKIFKEYNRVYYCDIYLCDVDGDFKALKFRVPVEENNNVGWSHKSTEEANLLSDNYLGFTDKKYSFFSTEKYLKELEKKDKKLIKRYEKIYNYIKKRVKESTTHKEYWVSLGHQCIDKIKMLQTPHGTLKKK